MLAEIAQFPPERIVRTWHAAMTATRAEADAALQALAERLSAGDLSAMAELPGAARALIAAARDEVDAIAACAHGAARHLGEVSAASFDQVTVTWRGQTEVFPSYVDLRSAILADARPLIDGRIREAHRLGRRQTLKAFKGRLRDRARHRVAVRIARWRGVSLTAAMAASLGLWVAAALGFWVVL